VFRVINMEEAGMRNGSGVRSLAIRAAILGALATVALPTMAQTWPTKPVRVIFPYPGGSAPDTIGRLLVQGAQEILGQPFIWENRGGANGVIATELLAKAPADGYMISFTTTSAFLFNPFFYKGVNYDVLKDFTPVMSALDAAFATIVNSSQPIDSVPQLIEYANRNPDKLNCGSFGNGSMPHLYCELIRLQAGAKTTHVPYKGAAQLVTDLSAGRVDLTFLSLGSVLSLWKAGKVRILAMNSGSRYPGLPEIPAITEALPKIDLLANWMGVVAPAGLPAPITQRLHGALAATVQSADFRKRLAELYWAPVGNTPEQFAAQLRAEHAVLANVVKSAGIKPE
jgi:tripartite-type tricarboxylate transporter receptor subunit TctC